MRIRKESPIPRSRPGRSALAVGLGLLLGLSLHGDARAQADAGAVAGGGTSAGAVAGGGTSAGAVDASAGGGGMAPTRVMIRAVANDAKVIGSNVGGARIVVREVGGTSILAEGVQEGSTGDTETIMRTPRPRGATAYGSDPEAAGFVAELSLTEPTLVEIMAEAPLGTSHAIQRASKTMLVVPGRDVLGEGVILVLNGFTVELLRPEVDGARVGEAIPVRARVTMLCGCPTEPGGMWDAEEIDIVARAVRDGEVLAETPLGFSGETSVYEGRLTVDGAGPVTLRVLAMDPEKANFGMVERELGVTN